MPKPIAPGNDQPSRLALPGSCSTLASSPRKALRMRASSPAIDTKTLCLREAPPACDLVARASAALAQTGFVVDQADLDAGRRSR